MLQRPCWLSKVPGNILCFDVKEDERSESLLDRYPVWYYDIWYIMFSEQDLTWSMVWWKESLVRKTQDTVTIRKIIYKMKRCKFKWLKIFNGRSSVCGKPKIKKRRVWISLISAAVCSPASIQLTLRLKICFSAITEYQKCSVVMFYIGMPLLPGF